MGRLPGSYRCVLLILVCWIGACRTLVLRSGSIACSNEGHCPSPFTCAADRCVSPDASTEDASEDARHPDSPSDGDHKDGANSDVPATEAPDAAGVRDTASADTIKDMADAESSNASEADSSVGDTVATIRMFGSTCGADSDCEAIGPSYFCLKNFQNATISGGLCTRPCAGPGDDCDGNGACITEASDVPHTPLQECLPTCKADLPCRTSFMCQFVYLNGMLTEPSICAPIGAN